MVYVMVAYKQNSTDISLHVLSTKPNVIKQHKEMNVI
jgi:hypothetical protein